MTTAAKGPQVWRNGLGVVFAMFAVFFGAGNLIFPPMPVFRARPTGRRPADHGHAAATFGVAASTWVRIAQVGGRGAAIPGGQPVDLLGDSADIILPA